MSHNPGYSAAASQAEPAPTLSNEEFDGLKELATVGFVALLGKYDAMHEDIRSRVTTCIDVLSSADEIDLDTFGAMASEFTAFHGRVLMLCNGNVGRSIKITASSASSALNELKTLAKAPAEVEEKVAL